MKCSSSSASGRRRKAESFRRPGIGARPQRRGPQDRQGLGRDGRPQHPGQRRVGAHPMQTFAGSWSFPSELGTPFLSGELTTDARPRAAADEPQVASASRSISAPACASAAAPACRSRSSIFGRRLPRLDPSRAAVGADVWLRLPGLEALSGQGHLVEGPICRLRLRAAAPSGRARHDREALPAGAEPGLIWSDSDSILTLC